MQMLLWDVIGVKHINVDKEFYERNVGQLRMTLEKHFQRYSRAAIDDILADVFLRAIEKQDKYDPADWKEITWLRMIMRDIIYEHENDIGHTRDAMNMIVESLDDNIMENEDGEALTGHDVYAEEDGVFFSERYTALIVDDLDYYLGHLPARLAVVVTLRLVKGHTWAEVGEAMNCSGENARHMCKRAEQEIVKMIEGEK